jgi:hypothetical protein
VTEFSKTFLVFYKWPDLTDVQGLVRSTVWPHLAKNQKWSGWQKYFAAHITLAHDEILTNGFLRLKRGTLGMRIAVSRE